MKIFKFSVIEREICTWWMDQPKLFDFFYTNADTALQKCFDKTIEFKKKMTESGRDKFSIESIWELKTELNRILDGNKLYGLKYEENYAEINFEIFDLYLDQVENAELYRQRVRQYSVFFDRKFSDKEIHDIHPMPTMPDNPAGKSFILPMIEKKVDHNTHTFLEFFKLPVS